jgi:hypothetical protein
VNVNQAKKILYDFKENENDKIHCIYCISGQLKNNNELTIELIPEEKLEDAKKKFQHFFIHVYSIEAQSLNELDPLVAENYDIINNIDDNPQDYSMIQCNDIHKREREIEGSSIDQIQDVKHEPINNSTYNSNKNLKDIKKEKNDFFKKTTSTKKNKVKDAKAAFFDKFKTKSIFEADNDSNKKAIKKEQPKNMMESFFKEKTIKKSEEESSEPYESDLPKEKIKKEEIKKEIEPEAPKLTEAEKKKKLEEEKRNMEREKEIEEENERLRQLFDDDDISSSISKLSNKKRVFIEDDDNDDDDDENRMEEEEEEEDSNYNIISNEEPKKLVKSDDPRAPGRRRYRVVKQETYMDDKGYLVTKDVSEWVSESESEENSTSVSANSTNKQKSLFNMKNSNKKRNVMDDEDNSGSKKSNKRRKGTIGGEKTQKSILSFFGKH